MRRFLPAACAAALVAVAGPAFAQAQLLGDHSAWSAYSSGEGGSRICFVSSAPSATTPQVADAGETRLYITHRPGEGVRNELNLVAGYVFAADSQATATVGTQNFVLVTAGQGAWLGDPTQAADVVGSMRAGSSIAITGTSDAGTSVTQTFSLAGVTAATNQINEAC